AALWSRDRRFCVFNDAFRQLLGFCEHDLGQATSMWMDRIHPQDRERVATAWNKLQNGGPKISCGYRFLPKHRTQEIQLRELSFSYCLREKETPAIWSFYTEDLNVRSEEHRLNSSHQIISYAVFCLKKKINY